MLFRNDDSNATRNLASKLSVAMTGGHFLLGHHVCVIIVMTCYEHCAINYHHTRRDARG